MNFARFYLPRLFPDYNGKMVYLDDDIIVQGQYDLQYILDILEQELGCVEIGRKVSVSIARCDATVEVQLFPVLSYKIVIYRIWEYLM